MNAPLSSPEEWLSSKLGHSLEVELREKRQRLEDALSATRAAMDEGIVAGGGTSLVRAAQAAVSKYRPKETSASARRLHSIAGEGPLKLIAENAGVAGDVRAGRRQKRRRRLWI